MNTQTDAQIKYHVRSPSGFTIDIVSDKDQAFKLAKDNYAQVYRITGQKVVRITS